MVEEINVGATMESSTVLTDTPTESTATTEQTEGTKPTMEESQLAEPELTETKSVESETLAPVIYDPYQIVSLIIYKCQAGGMITTEDNLANLLVEGKITQAEYDEYYPLDGLEGSYYSVFVETDLNIASDIAGNKLGSVDSIADYIARTLLLETQPIFNVTYVDIYTYA